MQVQDLSSKLYTVYPSKAADPARYSEISRRGFFEDICVFVGLGFNRKDVAAMKVLCSTTPSSGIFSWSKEMLEHVSKVKFAGCSTLAEKQLHMIGYMFELLYDLMISPRDNVSRSPGFETPLGIFGGSD